MRPSRDLLLRSPEDATVRGRWIGHAAVLLLGLLCVIGNCSYLSLHNSPPKASLDNLWVLAVLGSIFVFAIYAVATTAAMTLLSRLRWSAVAIHGFGLLILGGLAGWKVTHPHQLSEGELEAEADIRLRERILKGLQIDRVELTAGAKPAATVTLSNRSAFGMLLTFVSLRGHRDPRATPYLFDEPLRSPPVRIDPGQRVAIPLQPQLAEPIPNLDGCSWTLEWHVQEPTFDSLRSCNRDELPRTCVPMPTPVIVPPAP
jgi:hypothetical protein